MAYIPPLNGGRINASIGGNSTSAGAGYSLISTGNMILAGGNNITLSQNGGSITISGANAPSGSINFSASNTSANLASVTFANANGISFGLNAGSITASHNGITSQSIQTQNMVSFGGSTGNIVVSNANNVSFGGAGSVVTASASFSQTNQTLSFSAGSQSALTATGTFDARSLFLNGVGAASVGFSNSSMFVSVPTNYLTTARASNDAIGLNTAQTNVTWTANSSGLSINAAGYAGTGFSGTNASGTLNSNGLQLSVGAGGGGGGVALYDGAHSISSGTASIQASGALTASITNQTLNLSVPAQSNLSATGAVSISNNGNTISVGAPIISLGMSTLTAGGGTGGTSGTVSNGLQLAAGSNITLSQSTNTNGATVSIYGGAGGGGGGGVALYDGANSISSGTASFSDGGGVNWNIGGQTISANVTNQFNVLNNTTGASSTGTLNATGINISNIGAMSAGLSGSTLQLAVPATSSLSATGAVSISTNGATISIGAPTIVGTNGISISSNASSISVQPSLATAYVNMLQGSTSSQTLGAMNAAAAGSVQFYPVSIPSPVAFDAIRVAFSASFVSQTSSGAQTISHSFGLYSQNVSTLSLISSNSMGYSITNNSISGTVSYATSTGTAGYGYGTTSAGAIANLQASFGNGGGLHMVDLQFGNTMSVAPGMYWLALNKKESSVNSNVGMSLGLAGNIVILPNNVAPFGSATSAVSSVSALKGPYVGFGAYTATSNGIPSSAGISNINHSLTILPFMTFIST